MRLINFAKIFETEIGQVLVTKVYDSDDEKSGVRVSIATEILDTAMTLGFNEEGKRDELFENFTILQATEMGQSLLKTIEELSSGVNNNDEQDELDEDDYDEDFHMQENY